MGSSIKNIGMWGGVPMASAYLLPKVFRLDRWTLQQQADLIVLRLALKDASGAAKSNGLKEVRQRLRWIQAAKAASNPRIAIPTAVAASLILKIMLFTNNN